MASLSNYLLTHRKRLSLSHEEVAFLLGVNGEYRANKASRDERGERVPSLRDALAYEAIYGRPVRELFAGLYDEAAQDMAGRAKLLSYRTGKSNPKRRETLNSLVSKFN